MQTKLTLRLDAKLIEGAKKVAEERDTSLSRMVADYFSAMLRGEPSAEMAPLPPKTKSLLGVLRPERGSIPDESDHAEFLEEKYS